MKVYDDSNYKELIGDGRVVIAGGERRLLSAIPKPVGYSAHLFAAPFGDSVPRIPRSDYDARIDEQEKLRARVSDIQKWESDNQGSFPTCWAAGTVAAYSTLRVMMGMPFVRISAMSVAVPISGGRRGGYEGDAVEYLTVNGGVDSALWPYTDPSRKDSDPAIQENRKLYRAVESYEGNGFEDFATAALLGWPMTVSYNWWSHVVMLCDLVRIEAGSYGFRIRNNWGHWGDKHPVHGFDGYSVMREGRGTPGGGYMFRQSSLYYSTAA